MVRESWMGGTPPPVQHKPGSNDSRQPITARLTIRMAAKNGWRESPYTNNL